MTLTELHEVARAAGVPDPKGLPLSALVAAMSLEESGGNPRVRPGDHGTSYGILQVHEPDWPEIASRTRALAHHHAPGFTDYGRAIAEIKLVKPILEDASKQAVAAAEILSSRGFSVGPTEIMLLIDAAWQGPGVKSWAERTTTGDVAEVREGTAPGRTHRVMASLEQLGAVTQAGLWAALAALFGLGALFALLVWAVGEWEA